jgi:hypothetical protein
LWTHCASSLVHHTQRKCQISTYTCLFAYSFCRLACKLNLANNLLFMYPFVWLHLAIGNSTSSNIVSGCGSLFVMYVVPHQPLILAVQLKWVCLM